MPVENEKKIHKISDIADELQVGAQDVLAFIKEQGIKVATSSSKVTDSVRELVLDHYSDEKKKTDLHRKHKEEKQRKLKRIEASLSAATEKAPSKKRGARKQVPVEGEHEEADLITSAEETMHPEVAGEVEPAIIAETSPAESAEHAEPEVTEVSETDAAAEPEFAEHGKEELAPGALETTEAVSHDTATPEATTESPATVEAETEAESAVAPESIEATAAPEETTESIAETAPETAGEEELSELESVTGEEEVEEEEISTSAETEEETETEEGSDLKSEISRQQTEIGSRFSQVENIGGLKVLGNIQLQKKKRKRKKNFREQAKDLKQEFAPGTEESSENKEAGEAKKVAAAKGKETGTPVKKTPREEQIERLQQDGGVARGAKKKGKKQIDEKVIDRNIRETMMTMDEASDTSSRQKFRKIRRREREREQEMAAAAEAAENKIVKITEFASTHELADLLGVTPKEVIEKCFKMGKFITINQRLDRETIELLAMEFNQTVRFVSDVEATEVIEEPDHEEDLAPRPPVVTIMGHVDHGKTSLLDYIRNSNVVAGESGGITQHIGAYEVSLENGQKITFLDTPGHEAFTAMRARGAQVTDVVILVVAADDNVMPQTIEAINHAKAASVPIVVAINKIDKPDANPDKIRTQLAEFGVLVEEWGGNIQSQEISAKKGLGIRELMDKVLTEAELLELKANHNPNKLARGVVIEAELDKGKGVVTTVLVQNGFLKVGQPFVAGSTSGRIRAMLDERSKRIEEASPSQPVRILGFEELPQSGDVISVMENDRDAREIAQRRKVIRREQEFRHSSRVKLNDIARQVQEGKIKELRVIIKADTDGSIQALADGLMKVQTEEVKVEVIHRGVGQITETDVLLAAASDAIIIGFRVRPNLNAKRLAEKEEIDVRFYSVIYHVIEDVHDALEGMLSPELQEKVTGTVEIREVFRISKVGNVAGCYVLDGKIGRDNRVRLLRDGIQIHEGELDSLKRFKEDVKEVQSGFDCGLTLKGYDDIKVGDIVEAFETVETKRKLVVS